MHVIVVYDAEPKRGVKLLKFLRQYLNWVQNSVFEGDITEANLLAVENGINEIINKEHDSVVIYKMFNSKSRVKKKFGKDKSNDINFL